MKIKMRRLKSMRVDQILDDYNLGTILQEALAVNHEVRKNRRRRYRDDREAHDGMMRVPAVLVAALIQRLEQLGTVTDSKLIEQIEEIKEKFTSGEQVTLPGGKGIRYQSTREFHISAAKDGAPLYDVCPYCNDSSFFTETRKPYCVICGYMEE